MTKEGQGEFWVWTRPMASIEKVTYLFIIDRSCQHEAYCRSVTVSGALSW